MNEEEVKKLYNALVKKGYSTLDIGREKDFVTKMEDKENRRRLYDHVSSRGNFRIGDYDTYERRLTVSPTPLPENNHKKSNLPEWQTERKETAIPTPDTGHGATPGAGSHAREVVEEYDRSGVEGSVPSGLSGAYGWKSHRATEADGSAEDGGSFTEFTHGILKGAHDIVEGTSRRLDDLQEYGGKALANGYGQTVDSGYGFNPGTGKMERTYLAPTGERTFDKTAADAVSREYREAISEAEEARKRKSEEEAKMMHDPTLWESVKKSLGSGFLRTGAGLLDAMQALGSGIYVQDPSNPTGYTKTPSYEEALFDENNQLTKAIGNLHDKADKMSEEAQPHSGRKGFLDMLWDGEIGGFLQKGIAAAGESLPMTLSAFNPYTMTLNAISMAGSNFRENTLKSPDIPAWKRAGQAIGSAAIEQAVEKYADPIFKYVGGRKILKGTSKNASGKISAEITKDATETLAKRIYGRLKGLGKDALGEGAEEVASNVGNDVLGETLDFVDGNEDYGLRAQWEKMRKENPRSDLWDFAKSKAKENVESFIGGAMAGAYTSGTAQLSTKALQYSFDKLGNGSVEGYEESILNPINVDVAQSYDDGYSEEETTELQDTKNLYELRQNKIAEMLGVDTESVDETIGDPIDFIGRLQQLGQSDEIQPVLDYVNSKAKYDGMIQRVRDDIDGRIDQSNTMIDSRTNRTTGMIQGATLKVQDAEGNDRRVYVLDGNLATLPDGTGIDHENSDGSIIIRDADTGAIEMVSPDAIFSVEQPVDPETEKQAAAEAIRQQYGRQEAGRIDGAVAFNPGDTYTLTGEDGQPVQVQIVANEDGIVDNGDGTVNVSADGGQTVTTMGKEDIQAMVDATNRARVEQAEPAREAAPQEEEAARPEYSLNDEVELRNGDGSTTRGVVVDDNYNEGTILIQIETPQGERVIPYTREELDRLTTTADDENIQQNGVEATENGNIEPQNIPEIPPQSAGRSLLGNIYNQFKGKAREAIEFLKKRKEGVAQGALHHQDIGDIDIAWGNKKMGLAHILDKHPNVIDGLQERIDDMNVVSRSENRIVLESNTHKAVISKMLGQEKTPQWLLTAYEKKSASGGSSDIVPEPAGMQNGTAPLQDTLSKGEVMENPGDVQVDGGESALERIPKDEQGQPLYEQADPETAWDAIVEQAEGDEAMAQSVADSMVADKEAELKKIEKVKPKTGTTIAEKIAAERERKNAVEQAKATLAYWRKIAQTAERRRQAAMAEQAKAAVEAARLRREQEEKERTEREEADRIRREALNGVPDFVEDTPQDARARGYRRVNGEKVDRQQAFTTLDGGTAIPTANERFNEELHRYSERGMDKNEMFHLGHPKGVLRMFLPDLPIIMRQRVVNKGSNRKHDVEVAAMENMPQYISEPIFVFKKRDDTLGVLTEMEDRNGRNVFVAFDIASSIQNGGDYLEVNNVTTVHGRRSVNVVKPILENGSLQWVDKEKALDWFSSASPDVQQEITFQELSDATKIVENFENPSIVNGNAEAILGKEVQVKFDDKNIPTGHVALIEAGQLQPSHINGRRNPFHFIDEAQPKERNDEASVMSARNIAANIRPEEITSSVTAYTGAPTVNTRGEVVQGNNRSAALREMWTAHPEEAARYKQYLADHAADFGLAPEDVEAMQQPVLVNMLDVADDDAITLGQFVAQDTESGGTERIKPKNIVQKMGDDMRSFANQLLASPDEEMSFAELIDRNGLGVLKWMQQKGYITPTQYKSAFDSKGGLTAEAKNDLKGVMYQSIFQNGSTHLEEMFNALPSKAQKAILATAYRDYDSPDAERLNAEIQNSISAYYALSQDPAFAGAKNYKETRMAVEAWKRQYALDDVTGESYLPAEKYSNFALLLATMYKGHTQTFIQNMLGHIFDLVQGTQETTLFDEPDNMPRTLVEAINETLSNLREELLLNGNFVYNGQQRSNILAGGSAAGQQRRQGSDGGAPAGERDEDGNEPIDNSTRIERDSGQLRNDEERKDDLSEINEISSAERTEMESRIVDWLSEENLSRANGKTREEIFDEFGNELMPIAYIPTQFISLVSTTLKDQRIYCGKGYFIDHALRNHARAGSQISVEDVDVSKYLNIQTVLDNPDHIKETSVDGKRTVVFIKKIGRFFAELTQVEENGKIGSVVILGGFFLIPLYAYTFANL